jgi:hypothetical protein
MYLNKELRNVGVKCINLLSRKDRKTHMKLQCKNKKIPIQFYTVKENKEAKRGCLESHCNIIEEAKNNAKYDHMMILEDDAKIIRDLIPFPDLPESWDILYLGGTVHQNMGKYNENWTRIATWTCHAYILNMKNNELIEDILKARDQDKEIDEYMIKNIHYKYKVYMITPMRIIQRHGYSDIEKGKVNYDFMESTLNGFRQPEFEKTIGGNMALKVDFVPPELLPSVSIITPTYNRRKMFSMAIRNFSMIEYPPEKIEWIIIDDSEENKGVEDMIPRDKRIKYIPIHTKDKMSVAHKRNIGVKEAKNEYIIHMDDDDYYPPGSVMLRVKLLMQYKEKKIGCIGCSRVGIYDMINNKSSIATDGQISLSEASMAYKKEFWEKQNFNELEEFGEYKSFISGRFEEILDVPYSYIIIAISHKTNFTGTSKKIDKNVLIHKDTGKEMNFYDTFDEETKEFIESIRKIL